MIPLFKFGMLGKAAAPFTGTISFVGGTANESSATITLPGSPAAGDIALIFDCARSTNSTPPTFVTPSGFTPFGTSQTGTDGSSRAYRFNKSYKVLAGGESSITGMNGAGLNSKVAIVLRKTAGTWVAPAGIQETLAPNGSSSGQTVTVGASPQVVFAAGLLGNLDLVLTPAATGLFDDADAEEGGYLLQNVTPANTAVAYSGYRGLCSGYIGLVP